MKQTDGAEVIQVIWTNLERRGDGSEENPHRNRHTCPKGTPGWPMSKFPLV